MNRKSIFSASCRFYSLFTVLSLLLSSGWLLFQPLSSVFSFSIVCAYTEWNCKRLEKQERGKKAVCFFGNVYVQNAIEIILCSTLLILIDLWETLLLFMCLTLFLFMLCNFFPQRNRCRKKRNLCANWSTQCWRSICVGWENGQNIVVCLWADMGEWGEKKAFVKLNFLGTACSCSAPANRWN